MSLTSTHVTETASAQLNVVQWSHALHLPFNTLQFTWLVGWM